MAPARMPQSPPPDPSMDDILASIRRIISEDAAPEAAEDEDVGVDVFKAEPFKAEDEPEAPVVEAPPVEAPHAESEPAIAAEPSSEVHPPAAGEAQEPAATSAFDPEPAEAPASASSETHSETHKESATVSKTDSSSDTSTSGSDESLVGEASASATASAFDSLKSAAGEAARDRAGYELPATGRTLEDLTGDLLRPILKAWLDENLPAIVQETVNEEVARLARGRAR